MYLGAAYYPEHWIFPYDGTEEQPESRWDQDAEAMAHAGLNVVRMGEFAWGLCEREEGKFDFGWLQRAMDVMHKHNIQVVLATPTAAPPIWLTQKHPQILPLDENGLPRREGTRRAYSVNSNVYWDYSKKIVTALGTTLGKHPALVGWQIDNGIGRHGTEYSFNAGTHRDWSAWLQAKYETIEKLNQRLGLAFWGQVVSDWSQVPMPMSAPAPHNPALVTDWRRFSSDTCVAFVRMQADLLRELSPDIPATTTLRPFAANFDYFDMAEVVDFVGMDSDASTSTKASEVACSIDFIRSLKKSGSRLPGGEEGFWVMEQKAGHVAWGEVNSLVRPGITRLFTYQQLARGANGVLYFYWRPPCFGQERFYGGVLTHDGRAQNRMFQEVSQVGDEVSMLAEALKGTKYVAEVAILYSFPSEWARNQPLRPNKFYDHREHINLFHSAMHDRNVPVDFARPTEDLSKYKLVIVPTMQMLSGGEADLLRLYVQNGGTLLATFNTGLINEDGMVPTTGIPTELTDVFGLQVGEFDPLPPGEENHLAFKAGFQTTHLHPARLWCDIIEPGDCQVLATYTKDFYAGKPAITINEFGEGKAVYIGTMSHPPFYIDLVNWARPLCGITPLLRVPDQVEVSVREKDTLRLYFLLNHNSSQIRVTFLKPVHNFLTGQNIASNYDIPAHGVLILDETIEPL
ncbi:MAG: beta-galactosidase [Verrucomicrobia bacterium]|nr:beta-galactosidase [Verrucomicrobiota bacterium]